MKLPRGITGFFQSGRSAQIPEVTFAAFKRIIYETATQLGAKVDLLRERGITPNFHAAEITIGEEHVQILCNATHQVFALTEPTPEMEQDLKFIDHPGISEALSICGVPTILTASCLSSGFETADLTELDSCERDQIKYWKPRTISEVVFNWWD